MPNFSVSVGLGMFAGLLLNAPPLRGQGDAIHESGSFRSDSAELRYAFDRPTGKGPFPVVILVHGSGRTTKDEMLNIVPKFLERGFAVFRYDKRGVGESGGTFRGVNAATSVTVIPQLARDAAAAFQTACEAPGIDRKRCGFFGASQAGWVIPEAIRLVGNAAFGILFSGVTVPVGAQMFFANVSMQDHEPLDSAYARLPAFSGDRGFDSRSTLERINTPTLWLLGLKDPLLPNRLQGPQLDSLRVAGKPVRVRLFPDYTHSLGPDVWTEIDTFLRPFASR